MSPYTALMRRAGNPFEIANVLCSWLLGANYEAYVVVGCAARDVCMNIRYRSECPEVPDETPVVEEVPIPEEEPRYKLVPLPDYNSKYVKMMADRAIQAEQDKLDRIEMERQLKIKELELPPNDPIDGWRTHAWILVMPGFMGVEEPFFIEPAEGNAYPLNCKNYQQIDSIYNNENYYANIQALRPLDEDEWEEEEFFEQNLQKAKETEQKDTEKSKREEAELKRREEEAIKKKEEKEKPHVEAPPEPEKVKGAEYATEIKKLREKAPGAKKEKKKKKKKVEEEAKVEEEGLFPEEEKKVVWQNLSHLSYDLNDLSCWEHLLPGEPFHRRTLIGVDNNDKRTARITEKHLDMPESWVEKLLISSSDYEQRYPGCHKVIHYKRVLLEKFSRYSEITGIVKRITVFQDYALTIPLLTYEYFSNRDDKMLTTRIDHKKQEVTETFETGRPDYLIKHEYSLGAPIQSIEGNRTLTFQWESRLDQLEKIVCTSLTFDEYYKDRTDRLETRYIKYSEGTKAEPKRRLQVVTEVYSRNYNVPAKHDIWKRIFNIAAGTIDLLNHYEYNFVTNDTRNYIKPNLAETGGKIPHVPEKTSGYIADPCAKPPRPLDIYMGLCENIEWEYRTTKHIREYETDVNNYLKQRYKELTEPTLFVSLFNTERNAEAQAGYFAMVKQRKEMEKRATEADVDPLQPYLARMFGVSSGITQPLSVKEAALIREQCLNDFKSKMLARQLLVQERFDKMNAEYKAKRLWYLANQFVLTPEKEATYFIESAELSFNVHTLEVRLTRHQDLSAPRYQTIEAYLNKHPLLVEYNRFKIYYRQKI